MCFTIQVGDRVTPKTKVGLQLGDNPHNGKYRQTRGVPCVFAGEGVVIDVKDIVIDYDSWPDSMYDGLGKVPYRNLLIRCETGTGWAGEGAVELVAPKERTC